MDDRRGIPTELPRNQVTAGLRAMGIPPEDVARVVLDAGEDKILITRMARDDQGRYRRGPEGSLDLVKEDLEIRVT